MAVDDEHVVAHAMVEGDLGDDVHAGVAELQGDHGDVRLGLLEEVTVAAHGDAASRVTTSCELGDQQGGYWLAGELKEQDKALS